MTKKKKKSGQKFISYKVENGDSIRIGNVGSGAAVTTGRNALAIISLACQSNKWSKCSLIVAGDTDLTILAYEDAIGTWDFNSTCSGKR